MKYYFERKKDTIQFKTYFCRYDNFYDWSLRDRMKDVLRGVAHFETGRYDSFPAELPNVIVRRWFSDDIMEFPGCEKLRRLASEAARCVPFLPVGENSTSASRFFLSQ